MEKMEGSPKTSSLLENFSFESVKSEIFAIREEIDRLSTLRSKDEHKRKCFHFVTPEVMMKMYNLETMEEFDAEKARLDREHQEYNEKIAALYQKEREVLQKFARYLSGSELQQLRRE